MALTQRERAAWQALRRSLRPVPDGPGRQSTGGKRLYSGYSPAWAARELTAAGWEPGEAQAVLRRLILLRFPAFADSWNRYLSGHGFMFELDSLPPETQAEYETRYQLRATHAAAEQLAEAGPLMLADPQQLAVTFKRLSDLQRSAAQGSPLAHPAFPALLARYQLEPKLSEAVVLYQRAVPRWVILLILAFAVLAGLVSLVNFTTPQQSSPAALIAGPLFSLTFFAVAGWLWREAPRHEREWRGAVERWHAAWLHDSS